nr:MULTISPECIES: hypothetical protein [unclassified Streptomyces]
MASSAPRPPPTAVDTTTHAASTSSGSCSTASYSGTPYSSASAAERALPRAKMPTSRKRSGARVRAAAYTWPNRVPQTTTRIGRVIGAPRAAR